LCGDTNITSCSDNNFFILVNMEPESEIKLFKQLDKIERGIYGDHENGVEGMKDKINHLEWLVATSSFFSRNKAFSISIIILLFEGLLEFNKIGILTLLLKLIAKNVS